jgi:hypothetical protein
MNFAERKKYLQSHPFAREAVRARGSFRKFGNTAIGRPFKEALQDLGYHPGLLKEFKAAQGFVKKAGVLAGPGIGAAFTAVSVYQGYKEGGIFGAAKEVGIQYGYNLAFRVATGSLSAVTALSRAVPLAAMYGAYKFGQNAGRYGRKTENLSFNRGFVDDYGTAATMRQRSLQAIQNSHVNSRSLLGGEGEVIHRLR